MILHFWPVLGGILLGWALGSNDAANIFGTGVTTNLIRFRTAAILIAVFVTLGAVLEGPKVFATFSTLSNQVPVTAFFSTLSAGIVVGVMSYLGLPVSTSQAIVGAVLGAGLLNHSANFALFGKVFLCWVLTPVGGIFFRILFYEVLSRVFRSGQMPLHIYTAFLRGGIILAGCYGAYALGSNNVGNVTGVFVAAGMLSPVAAALVGAGSISLGVFTFSKNVMYTIGKQIFPLDAFSALVVVVAEAATVHLFTQVGVPVSASQAVVGAVLGIGLRKNVRAVSRKRLLEVLAGWVFTPLSAGLLTAALYALLG